jgi:Ca2+/Na+ antiporter
MKINIIFHNTRNNHFVLLFQVLIMPYKIDIYKILIPFYNKIIQIIILFLLMITQRMELDKK